MSSTPPAPAPALAPSTSNRLLVDKHIDYVQSLDRNQNTLAYHLTEHLRMNGIYWGLTSIQLLGRPDALPRGQMIDWVLSCWDPDSGGFSPHPSHDPHIHSTLSAIQILVMQDAIDRIDKSKVIDCEPLQFGRPMQSYHLIPPCFLDAPFCCGGEDILSLFDPHRGSFSGDSWGETDSRFSYCGVSGLALLGGLDRLDRDQVVGFISRCKNFDGGFGMVEGAESHAAYVWTCVGTLAILDRLDVVDPDTLGWWLSERQLTNGGLNGRPEKLEDVCYSWWALATLVIIGRSEWIDKLKLASFILSCQDPDSGGIADRPDDMPDVWHTVFGLAGLSMLGYEGLAKVDPVFCMPAQFTKGILKIKD